MKKYFYPRLLVSIIGVMAFCNMAKAQYVILPDTGFALLLHFAGIDSPCLVGKRLDTTCSQVLNTTVLNLQSGSGPYVLRDLTGIQYFKNLDTLICSNGQYTALLTLPQHLMYVDCSGTTSLDTIYPLPNTLVHFDCNQCTDGGGIVLALPNPLPDSLQYLDCSDDLIDTLPPLPPHLTYLDCDGDRMFLASLPALPAGLQFLDCSNNFISSIPALPSALTYFICNGNDYISSLPALPPNLQTLECQSNSLSSLPTLPDSLITLAVGSNQITNLPALPASIQYFDCSYNQLTSLATLPDSLVKFFCSGNQISVLPPFPKYLYMIECDYNNLTSLPALPNDSVYTGFNMGALVELKCDYNHLTTLPPLPPSIQFLICDSNDLTSLPPLPPFLQRLSLNNNPYLTCLPYLTSIQALDFEGTPISCVPNYVTVGGAPPSFYSLPLCGLLNSGGCEPFWNISGKVYYDQNDNCQFDSSDAGQGYVKVNLYHNGSLVQQTFTIDDGNYSFKTTNGAYSVQVDTTSLPFKLNCPSSDTIGAVITSLDSLSPNDDFSFRCASAGFDLGVFSLNTAYTYPRPAGTIELFSAAGDLTQVYSAHCASGIGGQVQLAFNGAMHYQGPDSTALTPASVANDTITWNVADFGTINDWKAFNVLFTVDSSAIAGNSLCFTLIITPSIGGDYDLGNNTLSYCIPIVNSLDPNEKEVYPSGLASAGEWLTYTVRFQNTGTAPAINIVVKDTLDPHLDASTFQLLSYSAKNITQLFGNVVNFNFPSINLPDSIDNEPLSHGFVQYKVRVKSTLPAGTVIKNSASIYFDLNSGVVTNTTENCAPVYDSASASITCGDSINFGGIFYKQSGNYNDTLTAAGGCDSIVTLTLTVTGSDTTNLSNTICGNDSVLFNGTYYNQSGTYTAQLTSSSNCDSTVIFTLTVNPVYNTNTSLSITCGDSVSFNGGYIHLSGTYAETLLTVNGCDSSIALHVTVTEGDTTDITNAICSDDSLLFNGAYYNVAGIYTAQYTSVSGCDSTAILHLSVNNAYATYVTDTICAGDSVLFNDIYEYSGGSYVAHYNSAAGCDSIVTLQLTANPLPSISISQTDNDDSLIAQTSFPVQWYFDSAVIPGATNNILLVPGFGIYYATATNSEGCVAYSEIFYISDGIKSVNANKLFNLYPNPADDYTMIAISPDAIGSTMRLFDITGKELMSIKLTGTPQRLPLSAFPAGVYMVAVEANGEIGVKMLVKTE